MSERKLKPIKLTTIPKPIRIQAAHHTIRTNNLTGTEALMLRLAAEQPSSRTYWITQQINDSHTRTMSSDEAARRAIEENGKKP